MLVVTPNLMPARHKPDRRPQVTRNSFLLTGLLILGACSKAPDIAKRKPTVIKDPVEVPKAFELLSKEDGTNFLELPLYGDARDTKHFWSGDFWALKKGNINRRWNARIRIGFNHRSPTMEEALAMTPEKIAELSPSEKFDLLLGFYDYPLRKEVSRLAANEEAEVWQGISNGWAVASFRHQEPQPKTLVNPHGISIAFGSEDIKGLLAYYYTFHNAPEADARVGKPCQKIGCIEDVSPATFHLALANSIGKKKTAFLMDLDRSRDVWNHPVVAYESEYRGNADLHEKVTPGTHSIVKMKTTVIYVDEALNQTWAPVLGTGSQLETRQLYQYWLHLDIDGNVIGGEWKSNERPDYLWTIASAPAFSGSMEALSQLIDDPAPVTVEEEVVTEEPVVTEPEIVVPEEVPTEEPVIVE